MTDIIAGIILRKTPLTVGSLNITWKAQILSDAGELSAITKQIPEREILVECLRALLGRAMGLPIPRPMLLHDEALGLLFGSEELPHPDLKRAQLSLLLVETLLSRWDYLPSAIVFDEWIANPDRHGGNLLADGDSITLHFARKNLAVNIGLITPSRLAPRINDAKIKLWNLDHLPSQYNDRRLLLGIPRDDAPEMANHKIKEAVQGKIAALYTEAKNNNITVQTAYTAQQAVELLAA